ncbi:MAG: biopolymer transporter ExbD [Calditrichaeota bacterium]|nr:biopolymer transporter ExbD [Calditrichota bacterium]MCB9088394.1 biopolymer transporter ExbD [Calditrichia bacterium]MCB0288728.1 biopolymer transporter ExbD [Calditrichota bacterium]MCB0297394.1 biopolymer transporter ExbD [Calditrichota bacterium]MCB0302598.1 biopolymer transporter ExbD [Calditrichota bacterium]
MALKKRQKEDVEIPSSSLADIAFLLLVFFLVCTTIDVDKGLRLVLPPMDVEDIEINKENITNILINDAGQVLLDNEEVSVRDIERIVREELSENDKLIISLKTTRGTKYDVYIAVLDQLKRANATRISIADPEES